MAYGMDASPVRKSAPAPDSDNELILTPNRNGEKKRLLLEALDADEPPKSVKLRRIEDNEAKRPTAESCELIESEADSEERRERHMRKKEKKEQRKRERTEDSEEEEPTPSKVAKKEEERPRIVATKVSPSMDLRRLFKECQKHLAPPLADATRAFYVSLLEENPNSKIAIKYVVEHGIMPHDDHKRLVIKYKELKAKENRLGSLATPETKKPRTLPRRPVPTAATSFGRGWC